MKKYFGKSTITEVLLLLAVILQLIFVFCNLYSVSDRINYCMYVMNYILGFLIILNLVVKGITKHFLAIAFFACYMLFLMGQKPFEPHYDEYLTFTRLKLNTDQYFVFSCILYIGLAVTYYSYTILNKDKKLYPEWPFLIKNDNTTMKTVLTVLLVVTLPCAAYMQARIVLVRSSLSYTSGYLINVDVPAFVKVGYYVYSTVVLLYLALKPGKLQMFVVLGTFIIIEGGLQLFQGRRALFASTLLFAIWYLFKYYDVQKIKAKTVIRLAFIAVAMVMLFYIVEQARGSGSTKLSSTFIRSFLVSTGGSDSVIANTISRKNEFQKSGVAYLFDPLINNFLGNKLLGKNSSAQGLLYLQQHNSFSHWLSYMTNKSLYLSGHGMGSSYLAEVYLAFGLIGVFIVSVILGWLIGRINDISFNKDIYRTGLVLFFVKRLFTLPRDGLLSWFGGFIYLVVTYALLMPFNKDGLRIRIRSGEKG